MNLNKDLLRYIENNVFPDYEKNDGGHNLEHIDRVINRSLKFASTIENINYDMVYVIAAYHDLGHYIDAKKHEEISAQILLKDNELKKYFTVDEMIIMSEAIEDHRASLEYEPRSIYGKIISSADRGTDLEFALKRTYEYRKKHYPNMSLREIIDDSCKHLLMKFGNSGHACEKIYFEDIDYKNYLEELNKLLKNPIEFEKKFIQVNGLSEMNSKYYGGNMNILVTLNSGYINVLVVMLKSLAYNNKRKKIDVYVMNSSLTEEDIIFIKNNVMKNINIIDLKVSKNELNDAPITKRYPKEMYYRILAAYYLPRSVDKILYLDPDLVVINKLDKLYNMKLDNYYFAAATHIWGLLQTFNRIRLNMRKDSIYINSGVMLMNIKLLRKEQNREDVYNFIKKNKNKLMLPDQDVISGLYAHKILPLDSYVYNLTEKLLVSKRFLPNINEEWIRKNTVIIHYCGKNKPWGKKYKGNLNKFYNYYDDISID